MPFSAEKLRKALRKLRKSLKGSSPNQAPGDVHALRTRIRRVEADLQAFECDGSGSACDFLTKIAPIRKKAGRVRDMDVLTSYAAGLKGERESECLVQLLEHLGARRLKLATKLHRTLLRRRKKARGRLKDCIAFTAKALAKKGTTGGEEWRAGATASILELSNELAEWPKLDLRNLHAFRLKVKELRYVVQLTADADTAFARRLGEVKDAIGEWHDWNELGVIAAEVIGHKGKCLVRQQIEEQVQSKLAHALAVSNKLRRDSFADPNSPRRSRSGRRSRLREPAVLAALGGRMKSA